MPTQMVVGEIKYCPNRDIVYLFPDVIETVAARLEDAPFKPLHDFLTERGVTLDDLGEAVGCYMKYMQLAAQAHDKKLHEVLDESGWRDCKPEAQIAAMYYAGVILTGTFFKGVRDVVPLGGESVHSVKRLSEAGKLLDHYLSMPCWQRWIYRRYKWLRNLLKRGRGIYVEM